MLNTWPAAQHATALPTGPHRSATAFRYRCPPCARKQAEASQASSARLHAQRWAAATCLGLAVLSLQGPAGAKTKLIDSRNFENIPDALSAPVEKVKQLGNLLTGSHGKEVESCTRKCLPACLRGGEGAPGLGPLSMRRELIVFKDSYRSRKYCLSECTQVCAIQSNGGDGQPQQAK